MYTYYSLSISRLFPGDSSSGVVGGLERDKKYEFEVTAVVLVNGLEREGPRSDTVAGVVGGGNHRCACTLYFDTHTLV